MSVPSGDYNNYPTSDATYYSRLNNYTSGYSMNISPHGKTTSGAYIVPTWDPISYDSLVGPIPTHSGYSTISNAYGGASGRCQTTYRTALCGHNIKPHYQN